MNSIQRLAYPALALVALVSAFAAHAEGELAVDTTATQAFAQPKTRAQVQAELFQARADGSLKVYGDSYRHELLADSRSTLTREEVRAQVRVDAATGRANPYVGEDSGSAYLSRLQGARDASHVMVTAPQQPAR